MEPNIEKEFEKSRRLETEGRNLLKKSAEIHNKANHARIDSLLEKRLAPDHYRMINDLSEGEIVEFKIASDYYLVGKEGRRTFLTLVRGDQFKSHTLNELGYKSMQGTSYPIESLVGYYCGFQVSEIQGKEEDLIFVNPTLAAPYLNLVGMIEFPLEAIVRYERLRREKRIGDS